MHLRPAFGRLVAMLAVAALVVTACGPTAVSSPTAAATAAPATAGPATPGATTAPPTTAPTTTAPTTTAPATSAPATTASPATTAATPAAGGPTGGTLTIGLLADFARLNLHFSESEVTGFIYDFLIIPTPQGYEYRLAESVTGNPDATEWTVRLRANANWNDGTPVTANDVIYSWHIHASQTLSINPSQWDGVVGVDEWRAGSTATIEGISAPDEKTVVFRLKTSNGAFPAGMGDLISYVVQDGLAGTPDELKAMAKEDFDRLDVWVNPPVSSAPLQWVRSEPDQFVELVPNPAWYGTPVPWDTIVGRPIDLAVAAAQLQAGDVDMTYVPLGEIQRLKDLGFGTSVSEFPFPYSGEVNLITGRLADKRTRQAVAYACDSAGFTETYFGGSASFLPTYIQAEWVSTEGLNYYEYDPVKAKQLLDEAGWDYNLPIRWLSFNPNDINLNAYLDSCQSQLAEIGVKVERTSGADNVTPLVQSGEFEIYSHGGNFAKYDPALLEPTLTCAGIPGGKPIPGQYQFASNRPNYCNPELDRLFAEARATSEQARRADLYHQASLIINEDLPYLIHMPSTLNMAWNPKITVFPLYPVQPYIDRWTQVP